MRHRCLLQNVAVEPSRNFCLAEAAATATGMTPMFCNSLFMKAFHVIMRRYVSRKFGNLGRPCRTEAGAVTAAGLHRTRSCFMRPRWARVDLSGPASAAGRAHVSELRGRLVSSLFEIAAWHVYVSSSAGESTCRACCLCPDFGVVDNCNPAFWHVNGRFFVFLAKLLIISGLRLLTCSNDLYTTCV